MPSETAPQVTHTEGTDQRLFTKVSSRIWQDDTARAIDRSALALEVHQAKVYLLGHVTRSAYRQRVADLAAAVPGVAAVHNRLVADPELVTEVAQALANDPRTRLAVLGVGAFYGWIHLSGEAPDQATRLAAEQVAARVPRVRGVLALPHLPHTSTARGENRRPLQPYASQAVYATDGAAGTVEFVVVSPHSRLVSHLVVSGPREINWRATLGSWLVPVDAFAQTNASGVFLSGPLDALFAQPAYVAADLCLPPTDWLPPFPYRVGDVRWLRPTEPLAAEDTAAESIPLVWPAPLSHVAA